MDLANRTDSVTIDRQTALKHVNRAKAYELRGRQSVTASANSKPLPGPALEAFTSGPITVAGHTVEKVVACRFGILQAVDSPIILLIENAKRTESSKIEFTQQQMWDICYLFTNDAGTVFDAFEKGGKEWLQKESKKEVGLKWEFHEVDLVMMAVMEQLKRHVETFVKFVAEIEEKGQITFFREMPGMKAPA